MGKQGLVMDFLDVTGGLGLGWNFTDFQGGSRLFLFPQVLHGLCFFYWRRKCLWFWLWSCGCKCRSSTSSCWAWGKLFNLLVITFLNHRIGILKWFTAHNYCEAGRRFYTVYIYVVMRQNVPLSPQSHVQKPQSPGPPNVTAFRDRAFGEAIKLQWAHSGGPQPQRTGVLTRRGNVDALRDPRSAPAQREDHWEDDHL